MDRCIYQVGTTTEVASMWGVTRKAIIDAIRRGRLEARKSGNQFLVAFSDAETYFKRPPDFYPTPNENK